jgi:hypothetical protein
VKSWLVRVLLETPAGVEMVNVYINADYWSQAQAIAEAQYRGGGRVMYVGPA